MLERTFAVWFSLCCFSGQYSSYAGIQKVYVMFHLSTFKVTVAVSLLLCDSGLPLSVFTVDLDLKSVN